eukprot:TRINITY_DN26713_c0_g1_i1.p1 TRINITY_DN26713_c0_g1~~TRINITY_DN26713_c0_g1_i1.p1  ORF type:complete len:252 (-),score=61.62 TRINITY_DN26713_c0_g1_i1:180-935(-)
MARIAGLCFIALVASSAFLPLEAKAVAKTASKTRFLQPAEPKSAIACSTCVNFLDDTLNTLLNLIVDGGIIGSCEQLCTRLQSTWEQGVCILLCSGVGIEAFIAYLDGHDNDPVYLCTDFLACPRNHCNSTTNCITITDASVSPSTGPVRTTFKINTKILVHQQTGTGVTNVIVTPPGNPNNTNPFGSTLLNEGYAPGTYTVTVDIPTDDFDWQYQPGVYQVEINVCGSDCQDKYGVVFDTGNTNFTMTKM